MRRESAIALERAFGRLCREFGAEADTIMRLLAEELGGVRLIFPDVLAVQRMSRNRMICAKLKDLNYEEVAILYHLHPYYVRQIEAQQKELQRAE